MTSQNTKRTLFAEGAVWARTQRDLGDAVIREELFRRFPDKPPVEFTNCTFKSDPDLPGVVFE